MGAHHTNSSMCDLAFLCVSRTSEIANFYDFLFSFVVHYDQQVTWLQILVNDILLMQIQYSFKYLQNVVNGLFPALKSLEKFRLDRSGSQFYDMIQVSISFNAVDILYYVRMVQL